MPIETLAALLNLTTQELMHQADVHTRTVQSWLSSRAPGAACMHRTGVKLTSTGLPIPLLNLALSTDKPLGASDDEIGDEIETVKAFFDGRGVPWYWWLGPGLTPSHLDRLLEQHGLAFDGSSLPAMVAPLPAPVIGTDPAITVWQAATRADLEAASRIRHAAFRFPPGAGLDYFEAMACDWLAGDPARLYLASVGYGPPAAIGALIMGHGMPGVYVMATLPGWQRRGLGKAILSRVLSEAGRDGHPFIVLTASRMGYPLYRQFGFEQVFAYGIYRLAGEAG